MDAQRLKQLAEQLRKQSELEKSLKVARQRQLQMLPRLPSVQGFEFSSMYLPASKVSGDFYDFFKISEAEYGISMGDVSGHGVEAGIVMGMAKKAIQIYARGKSSPKEVMCLTNEDLSNDLDGETFVSASYAVLDVGRRLFRFARAGHNPPILYNPARTPNTLTIRPNGMVIGVDKSGKRFATVMQEVELELKPGDLFFQYTDGVVEASNASGEEFGEKRLLEIVTKGHSMPLRDLLAVIEETITTFAGGKEQEDDITIVAFKVL
ncbi:MAG: serine/threonine-protein phosphatase [Planctomycetota bacterium]|nr:serine/threonine-protein phosphatase [Planctomycetota bacterium]